MRIELFGTQVVELLETTRHSIDLEIQIKVKFMIYKDIFEFILNNLKPTY